MEIGHGQVDVALGDYAGDAHVRDGLGARGALIGLFYLTEKSSNADQKRGRDEGKFEHHSPRRIVVRSARVFGGNWPHVRNESLSFRRNVLPPHSETA